MVCPCYVIQMMVKQITNINVIIYNFASKTHNKYKQKYDSISDPIDDHDNK